MDSPNFANQPVLRPRRARRPAAFSPSTVSLLHVLVGVTAALVFHPACTTTSDRVVQICNALTLAFGVWEVTKLEGLRKASKKSKVLPGCLLAILIVEKCLILAGTFRPVYNYAVMEKPRMYIYNWINRSRLILFLSVAVYASFLFLTLRSHHNSTVINLFSRKNPDFIESKTKHKYNAIKTMTPTRTVPSIAAATMIDFSPGGGNVTRPVTTIETEGKHVNLEIDLEVIEQEMADPDYVPSHLWDDDYISYRSSCSLDPPNLPRYGRHWVNNWYYSLPGDVVLWYSSLYFLSYLAGSGSIDDGTWRVQRGAITMLFLQLVLLYISNFAMVINAPRDPNEPPLFMVFNDLMRLIPAKIYSEYIRPRVAILLFAVAYTTRIVILQELEIVVTKEEWEEAVEVEVEKLKATLAARVEGN
ncbi:hypothetical protein P7C70_g6723, partial [Phenoliferia sp. Uapishka_3]